MTSSFHICFEAANHRTAMPSEPSPARRTFEMSFCKDTIDSLIRASARLRLSRCSRTSAECCCPAVSLSHCCMKFTPLSNISHCVSIAANVRLVSLYLIRISFRPQITELSHKDRDRVYHGGAEQRLANMVREEQKFDVFSKDKEWSSACMYRDHRRCAIHSAERTGFDSAGRRIDKQLNKRNFLLVGNPAKIRDAAGSP